MKQLCNKTAVIGFSIFLLCFLFSSSVDAQEKTALVQTYIKIEIKGLACPYCAFGMEKKLKKVVGVDNVEIELKEGLAYISTPTHQKPTKEALKKIILEGGFTVGKIEFSNTPFKRTESKKKE